MKKNIVIGVLVVGNAFAQVGPVPAALTFDDLLREEIEALEKGGSFDKSVENYGLAQIELQKQQNNDDLQLALTIKLNRQKVILENLVNREKILQLAAGKASGDSLTAINNQITELGVQIKAQEENNQNLITKLKALNN